MLADAENEPPHYLRKNHSGLQIINEERRKKSPSMLDYGFLNYATPVGEAIKPANTSTPVLSNFRLCRKNSDVNTSLDFDASLPRSPLEFTTSRTTFRSESAQSCYPSGEMNFCKPTASSIKKKAVGRPPRSAKTPVLSEMDSLKSLPMSTELTTRGSIGGRKNSLLCSRNSTINKHSSEDGRGDLLNNTSLREKRRIPALKFERKTSSIGCELGSKTEREMKKPLKKDNSANFKTNKVFTATHTARRIKSDQLMRTNPLNLTKPISKRPRTPPPVTLNEEEK